MSSAVIDVIITCAETRILKEKTKWTVRLLKVFTQLDSKLMYDEKSQTQLLLV